MSDNNRNDNQCHSSDGKTSYPALHFTALNSGFNNNKQLDETHQLLNVARRHKFIVVPANLPDSTVDFKSSEPITGDQRRLSGLKSVASSPAGFPIPAIVTPTKPKFFVADNELISVLSSPNVINSSMMTLESDGGETQRFHPSFLRSGSSFIFDEDGTRKIITDASAIKSLTTVSIGCTDGRNMLVRKVTQDLQDLVNVPIPETPPEDRFDLDSYDFYDEDDGLKPRRQHWENKMQFVLACIGYSVGLGNVWRFPYLCYKSGGGIFLIPYFIILFICGIPILFMELAVGQYTGRGPIGALGQICPLFKGVGLASVAISFFMSTYYSVIIAYAIYYFFTSFRPDLPWTICSIRWSSPDCWAPDVMLGSNISKPKYSRASTEEFFENKVLRISDGIEYPGSVRWELIACLVCAWILVYFALWKSIKSSSKTRYITATLPFVLIIVFLGRALTLEGADIGLKFFFKPNWDLLKDSNVWINAAAQVFNSLGITFGSMIAFASYNKYNNNMLHDTLAVSFVNVITCLIVGIFAFATLGNLALEQAISVDKVVADGPGFIFVVYTQTLAKMPAPRMWAVMFFFMFLCLGLNSQFAIVEVVVTSIQDGFSSWIKRKLIYHELLVLIICVISFFFGIPNIIQGGIYFFQLMDHYVASIAVIFLAFFETVAIAWFFGVGRLTRGINQMCGRKVSCYFRSCWFVFVPASLFSLFIFAIYNYKNPTYHNGQYEYPGWAHGLGWSIVSIALMCIPCYAMIIVARAEGDTLSERIKHSLTPHIYECKLCGEHHCDHVDDAIIHAELTPMSPESPPPQIVLLHSPSMKMPSPNFHTKPEQR